MSAAGLAAGGSYYERAATSKFPRLSSFPSLAKLHGQIRMGRCSAADKISDSNISQCQLPAPPDTAGMRPQGRWNAVSLAYLGDAVWEAIMRSHMYDPTHPRRYNAMVASSANTQAQAGCYKLLHDEGCLAASEAALMRWASNNTSVAPPPHATRQEYKHATAVEVLVAHLYLTDTARLHVLMAWLLEPSRLGCWQHCKPKAVQGTAGSREQGAPMAP
eukprot:GHRR01019490.1.p1 GENE.GHRR01019490.1~~GHRR01019490.1.p1  ORF type:complete len:218 (+),score=57.67 GHRR01019490.1:224-877(+)